MRAVPLTAETEGALSAGRVAELRALEDKILWLSVWTIHHANHLRPNVDGLKVGGHQASSASLVTLMTALYFDVLRPADCVAFKPDASPVFHAIQYLLGRQTREKLERFRAFGGAQSYPSRTKDTDDVDFSTGSVGLGVAMTAFAALTQEYLRSRRLADAGSPRGRMVALLGDAELDEGNVFEAMVEGCKHGIRDVWWIIDYNRQSLDAIVADRLMDRMAAVFRDMNWNVVELKHGRRLTQAFGRPGGEALREWLDACPNGDYLALANAGGQAWRDRLTRDLGGAPGVSMLLDARSDADLQTLMTNVGGHDIETIVPAFRRAAGGRPTCFIAYTFKGHRLPFAAHKDNHSGLMTPAQIDTLRRQMRISEGEEWSLSAGLPLSAQELRRAIEAAPFSACVERHLTAPRVAVPVAFEVPAGARMSTQEGFGRVLSAIARRHGELADRIVTTSPDVTTSTNLGPWVNRRGVFGCRTDMGPGESRPASPQKWEVSPEGQHIQLGIAENNLFIMLSALGLAAPLFGARLLPIGTVYDPFICRGLDALNYACYQDARFLLVATPSGLTLAPEGGAHQSIYTPLIGIGQPSLTAFEPAYVDELVELLRWSFEYMQADEGGPVYLRLSTRPLDQPQRTLTPSQLDHVVAGGYWIVEPGPDAPVSVVACGPTIQEATIAHGLLLEDIPEAGLLLVTSPDRLHRGWIQQRRTSGAGTPSHVESLLSAVPADAGLVTVLDGHSTALSWIGAVKGQRIVPLGVERFGQSGNVPDLYRAHGIDAEAIMAAAGRLCVRQD